MRFGIYLGQVDVLCPLSLVALLVCLNPHDDRRVAERHWYRGNRPAGAEERAGDERARRGSRGRCGRACCLDKTGTITLGNRQAVEFFSRARQWTMKRDWLDAAQLASAGGRDARKGAASSSWPSSRRAVRGRELSQDLPERRPSCAFTAQTPNERRGPGRHSNTARARPTSREDAYVGGKFCARDRWRRKSTEISKQGRHSFGGGDEGHGRCGKRRAGLRRDLPKRYCEGAGWRIGSRVSAPWAFKHGDDHRATIS